MKKFEAWIIAGIFTALVALPTMVFVAGARPEPNQNRPPTPLPEISVSGMLDRELTPQLDAYLEDALIIAPGAVAAEAWTDVALGDSPSDQVTLGNNGWLYYTFSLTRPCLSDEDVARFVDTIERAERAVAVTGRTLIVGVAPDKATVVPEFLPEMDTCVEDVADRLRALEGPDALVTVWDEMRKARADDRPIYFRLDTHWTDQGAAVMGEALVEALAPGGWDPDAVAHTATVDHEGDLTVLLGLPATEPADELETMLPDSTSTREIRKLYSADGVEYERVVAVDYEAAGDPVVPGHSLVMHDSYGWALTPMIAPYFESAAIISEVDPSAGHMKTDLDRAEIVVYEIVQRSIHEFVLDLDLAARFVAAYADSYEPIDARQTLRTSANLTGVASTDADWYLVVELPAGNEATAVTYGDSNASLTPASPRAAFHMTSDSSTLTASLPVDYYVVAIPR
ncbi:MAG: hypothetical protein QNJ77_04235 [Acidimicrobiia bacterium]|nr:hypothetical protein [Acidimicrobiia bacterium]